MKILYPLLNGVANRNPCMTPSVKMSSEYELNSSRKCVVLVKRPYSERALDSRLLTHVFTQFGAHPKAVTLLDSCLFLGLHSTT